MSADFLVRPTREADLQSIATIYDEAVLTSTASYEVEPPGVAEMTRRWQSLTTRSFPHLVAEDDGGTVLGYAYAGPYGTRFGYRFTVEDSVYIAPAAQRRGVGRALLTELIAICERAGFRQMIAVIGAGREHQASVGLHEKLGFRIIGVLEASGFKQGRWLDTLLMQRALGPGASTLPGGA